MRETQRWSVDEGSRPVICGFPEQKSTNGELWWFLSCAPEQTVKQTVQMLVIWCYNDEIDAVLRKAYLLFSIDFFGIHLTIDLVILFHKT